MNLTQLMLCSSDEIEKRVNVLWNATARSRIGLVPQRFRRGYARSKGAAMECGLLVASGGRMAGRVGA